MASYADLQDKYFDTLDIGGVDGEYWDPTVSACISYYLTLLFNGQKCIETFVLGDNVV